MGLPVVSANILFTRYALHPFLFNVSHTRAENSGSVGFVAINNADGAWSTTFKTGLPGGSYCNVIDGSSSHDGTCTGSAYVSFSLLLL